MAWAAVPPVVSSNTSAISRSPSGNERLVEFIERRVPGHDPDRSQSRHGQARLAAFSANCSQDQKAEDEVLDEMRALAYVMMDREERSIRSFWQQPVQNRDENGFGVIGSESSGGEDGNHRGPNQHGPPARKPARLPWLIG